MENFQMKEFLQLVSRDKRTLEMFRYLMNNSYIRVVNYHNTNPVDAERFEAEIKYFSQHFVEGFRNHYDVILPILDKYHFTGWFYLPSFFMDVPVMDQLAFSEAHDLNVSDKNLYPDQRVAMTWDEVREIAGRHEICCHTGNHFEITKETSQEDMQREIVEAKRYLEEKIGREVEVFCWLYGEEYHYNEKAHKFLKEAGYKYVVSNLKLERIR